VVAVQGYVHVRVDEVVLETTGSFSFLFAAEHPPRQVWVPKKLIVGDVKKGDENLDVQVQEEFARRHRMI
jgi:hypothetical protein